MTKKFNTYNELVEERERLEKLLETQKEIIHADFLEIKAQLQPARDAISFLGKITTKDRTNPLLNVGSDILINTVLNKFVLAKAGWIARLVVPFFVRNYSSHVVGDKKGGKWFQKLKSWLGHKNGKEKHN